MKKTLLIAGSVFAVIATGVAISAKDKYALKVPDGVAFAEFKGYEDWPVIAVSRAGDVMAVIVGNPIAINAYQAGIPGNGQPFPEGTKMAKIHWTTKLNLIAPGQPTIPDALHDVDFMIKDSKRFADSGGWGYGAFEYRSASQGYEPANSGDKPPQANDAKCGFACHTVVKNRDYVYTAFGPR